MIKIVTKAFEGKETYFRLLNSEIGNDRAYE